MPVVSRIFSSHEYPSLCKSCECESLSLFVGVYPDHGVGMEEHTCLEHYILSTMPYSFKRVSIWLSVSPMTYASQAGGNDW